jgi:hypothetical protein
VNASSIGNIKVDVSNNVEGNVLTFNNNQLELDTSQGSSDYNLTSVVLGHNCGTGSFIANSNYIGALSCVDSPTGYNNNVLGYRSFISSQGSQNILIGSFNCYYTTGDNNVLIGNNRFAFEDPKEVSNNTIVGNRSGDGDDNPSIDEYVGNNNIIIGFDAGLQDDMDNTIVIGNDDVRNNSVFNNRLGLYLGGTKFYIPTSTTNTYQTSRIIYQVGYFMVRNVEGFYVPSTVDVGGYKFGYYTPVVANESTIMLFLGLPDGNYKFDLIMLSTSDSAVVNISYNLYNNPTYTDLYTNVDTSGGSNYIMKIPLYVLHSGGTLVIKVDAVDSGKIYLGQYQSSPQSLLPLYYNGFPRIANSTLPTENYTYTSFYTN